MVSDFVIYERRVVASDNPTNLIVIFLSCRSVAKEKPQSSRLVA